MIWGVPPPCCPRRRGELHGRLRHVPFYKLADRTREISSRGSCSWRSSSRSSSSSAGLAARLQDRVGSHAIFAMVVPYCMIHYGSPGPRRRRHHRRRRSTLAMKTRSIWAASSFMCRYVAMDIAALQQQ